MTKNLFSVPIFFIVFRETLEASIIISVLLGLVEQIARPESRASTIIETPTLYRDDKRETESNEPSGSHVQSPSEAVDKEEASDDSPADDEVARKRLLRKMRIQVRIALSRHPIHIY